MKLERLIQLYEERLNGIAYGSSSDLSHLLCTDEKKFYFILMYYFLTKKEIPEDVKWSPILIAAITLFCMSCNNEEIVHYFSEQVNIKEVPEQIDKIAREFRQVEL